MGSALLSNKKAVVCLMLNSNGVTEREADLDRSLYNTAQLVRATVRGASVLALETNLSTQNNFHDISLTLSNLMPLLFLCHFCCPMFLILNFILTPSPFLNSFCNPIFLAKRVKQERPMVCYNPYTALSLLAWPAHPHISVSPLVAINNTFKS